MLQFRIPVLAGKIAYTGPIYQRRCLRHARAFHTTSFVDKARPDRLRERSTQQSSGRDLRPSKYLGAVQVLLDIIGEAYDQDFPVPTRSGATGVLLALRAQQLPSRLTTISPRDMLRKSLDRLKMADGDSGWGIAGLRFDRLAYGYLSVSLRRSTRRRRGIDRVIIQPEHQEQPRVQRPETRPLPKSTGVSIRSWLVVDRVA
jgi:hypothetical protein